MLALALAVLKITLNHKVDRLNELITTLIGPTQKFFIGGISMVRPLA